MRDTWYVLEDGSAVDPSEVAPDNSGALRHKDGRAVAMRGDVPSSRGVDPEEERGKSKAKPKAHHDEKPAEKTKESEPPKGSRQMKAEDDGGKYKTR